MPKNKTTVLQTAKAKVENKRAERHARWSDRWPFCDIRKIWDAMQK